MDIKDIIKIDPLFRNHGNITSEPLNGGFSNETHIVSCCDKKYVVKIYFSQNEYLNISRTTEMEVQDKAASMGISPKVLSDIHNKDYSISEFLTGHLITDEEINNETLLSEFISIMKKIHSITGIERTCSCFDLIDGYVNGIEKYKVKLPDGYYDILKKTDTIRNHRSKDVTNNNKYCHNDLLSCNIMYDNHQIKIIDWEISGKGDPYMDLATLPYQMNYSEDLEKFILKQYFGYYEDEMLVNLRNMRYIGLVREVVWALFYEGLNKKSINHNMNYYEAALYSLNRIKNGFLSL